MAKKSKIARNEQRKVIVARYNEKRIAPEEDPNRRERYPRGARSSTRGTAEAAPQRFPRSRA